MKSIKKPTVSVIIGTKNRAQLLPRAIKSVLNQTYTDFECIIIDGGSIDDTPSVIKKYKDERIIYIRKKIDPGRDASLNYALNIARGKYISFLDDDDEYLPTKLEKQVHFIENLSKNVGFVHCWVSRYDSKTGKLIRKVKPEVKGDIYEKQLSKQSVSGFPALLIKKEVIEKVGGMNDKVNYSSDWEWFCRLSRYYQTDFIAEILVKVYENHNYSRMSRPIRDHKHYANLIEFHRDFLDYHSDGFKRYPKQKYNHYLSLANSYAFLGNLIKALKYSVLSVYLEPLKLKSYRRLLSNFLRSIKII